MKISFFLTTIFPYFYDSFSYMEVVRVVWRSAPWGTSGRSLKYPMADSCTSGKTPFQMMKINFFQNSFALCDHLLSITNPRVWHWTYENEWMTYHRPTGEQTSSPPNQLTIIAVKVVLPRYFYISV